MCFSDGALYGSIGTVAVGSLATNREEVPVTRRSQFLLRGWQPQRPSISPGLTSLPQCSTLSNDYLHARVMRSESQQQAGLQLVQSLYQQACKGTGVIAMNSPAMRQRLSMLPDAAVIHHSVSSEPKATFAHKGGYNWHQQWITAGNQVHVGMTAGLLLQHKSAKQLELILDCEIARDLARHQDEAESYKLLIFCIMITFLGLGRLKALPAAVLAVGAWVAIHNFKCVDRWLTPYQEREADAMAAAISTAAGCRHDNLDAAVAVYHKISGPDDTV